MKTNTQNEQAARMAYARTAFATLTTILLLMTSAALAQHTGTLVPDPKAVIGTTGGTVTVSGYIAGGHYAVNCNSTGCSEDAGLNIVIRTEDGRFFDILPVQGQIGMGPLGFYGSVGANLCGDRLPHCTPSFTYTEKPLKKYRKGAMQLCVNGFCYVETTDEPHKY